MDKIAYKSGARNWQIDYTAEPQSANFFMIRLRRPASVRPLVMA